MYYIKDSKKTFEDACKSLEQAVGDHGFGLLHIHDLGNTLRSKGIEFKNQCRVFDVCNPQQASKVLANDMNLNMALPCRISVYTEGAITKIGMIKPKAMLSSLSSSTELLKIAQEVEETTIAIIEQA